MQLNILVNSELSFFYSILVLRYAHGMRHCDLISVLSSSVSITL